MTNDVKLTTRLPRDLKTWLDERAELDDRSLNSFIVKVLKAAKQAEQMKEAA